MSAARDRVARRLATTPTVPREELGIAVAASSGGHVEVQVGDRVWTVTDHPKRLTRNGDVVVVRTSGNTRQIAQNRTLDANPPSTTTPPSASTISPSVNNAVSSGTYDASSGDAFSYARDVAATTRYLAGDINELRDDVGDHAADIASLKATVNSLRASVADLRAALATQGQIA